MSALAQSHFAWFGLPERFALDPAELAQAYRAVQATVHPDRFAGASDADRRRALQTATQVNEAHRVLRDPVKRAAYLCELQGVDVGIETNTAMPTDFLMQQMEWREALDDAKGGPTTAIDALQHELDDLRRQLVADLGTAIDQHNDYAAAAGLVRRLMFVERFGDDVEQARDDAVVPGAR